MIEKIIYDYLNEALSVPVYMEVPSEPPAKFVIIQRTGGGLTNWVYNSAFAIQSYAGSLYEAAELNETVKAAMLSIVTLNEIASIRLNSEYNFTDSAIKHYRYQGVYDVVHY